MRILSQKGLFTAYLDKKLTVANTDAHGVERQRVFTSNGHANNCSMNNSFVFLLLSLKTVSQYKNVNYSKWIFTYASVCDCTMD